MRVRELASEAADFCCPPGKVSGDIINLLNAGFESTPIEPRSPHSQGADNFAREVAKLGVSYSSAAPPSSTPNQVLRVDVQSTSYPLEY